MFSTYMNLSQISFRETIFLVTIKPSVMKITIDAKPTKPICELVHKSF